MHASTSVAPPPARRLSPSPSLLLLLVAPVVAASCGGHRAPPAYQPTGQTKCSIAKSQLRPLVVEWPSADRLDLEAEARKGVVVVRYEGCELEVLRGCRVGQGYGYVAATRQDDRLHIRDEDALYANVPVHAAKFEAALQSAGELTVAMSMVGRYEAQTERVERGELQGDCARATHAIVSLTAGAFEFYTGAEEGSRAGVGLASAGVGARSGREHATLNRAGRAEACDKATLQDKAPPDGCGAVLRIAMVPIVVAAPVVQPAVPPITPGVAPPVATAAPSCAVGSFWDGAKCVALGSSPFCPVGMEWSGSGCFVPYGALRATGESGCPAGLQYDDRTGNCTPEGASRCPPGTRWEAGRGCMAGAAPVQQAPARGPSCPAGMVGLPGGAFRGTTHPSAVAPFCLDATEVTVDAYKACVDARRCAADGITCEGDAAKWANYGVAGRGRHPMNCVSWQQAVAYCAAQGKRLPSTHEWEWAARSGLEARKYPWGNGEPPEGGLCKSSGAGGTCPVGAFPASDSAHGVHDLAGNVSEWVSDVAQGWQHIKGGAWNAAWDNRDMEVGYTHDHWPHNKPDRYPYVGLRCAASVK